MNNIARIRILAAAVLALSVCGALGAQAASAYCTTSVFHPMKTTYSGLHATTIGAKLFGRPSKAVYNPYTTTFTPTITLTEEQTTGMTVSASVTVGASGLVASVEAQTGLDVSKSVSISTAVAIPVRIPAKRFGWVQAKVGSATVQGTVTQVDMICNKLYYRGPISATFPVRTPYLVPMAGLVPPR